MATVVMKVSARVAMTVGWRVRTGVTMVGLTVAMRDESWVASKAAMTAV